MNNLRLCASLLLILACTAGASLAQPLLYADDFAALGKLASARNVPIMLVFTRPDCVFSARAKKDHLEPLRARPGYGPDLMLREIEAANDLIPVRDFDGNMTTHAELARKYAIHTVPAVMLVDAQGKLLTEAIVGLNVPDFYNLYLEQSIDAARLQLRARSR